MNVGLYEFQSCWHEVVLVLSSGSHSDCLAVDKVLKAAVTKWKGSDVLNDFRDGDFDEFLAVVAVVSIMHVESSTWFYQCR